MKPIKYICNATTVMTWSSFYAGIKNPAAPNILWTLISPEKLYYESPSGINYTESQQVQMLHVLEFQKALSSSQMLSWVSPVALF